MNQPTTTRRDVLKKAGWVTPAIITVSLMNTASTISGDYGGGYGDKGGKGKGGKGNGGKGNGGKGKKGK